MMLVTELVVPFKKLIQCYTDFQFPLKLSYGKKGFAKETEDALVTLPQTLWKAFLTSNAQTRGKKVE